MKKSEQLALENVRRITEVLRVERNEALALAQVKREEAEESKALLEEYHALIEDIREFLSTLTKPSADGQESAPLERRVRKKLERIDAVMNKSRP